MEKRTMTVKELAEAMSISVPAAYNLTEVEGFPCLRVGKRKVISIAAFDEWLRRESENPQSNLLAR